MDIPEEARLTERIAIKLKALMPTIILDYVNNNESVKLQDCKIVADQILAIDGLCILDDDQSVPKNYYDTQPSLRLKDLSGGDREDKARAISWKQAQQDMLKANFRRIIPKEVSNDTAK